MAFYKIAEMQKNRATANPQQFVQSAVGEFMKAGIVTKPDEEGPPLHMHPNEEQFTLVLEGKLHFVLGDEERICERGDLIHIPRFTNHRSRAIGGPAVFFTVKKTAGPPIARLLWLVKRGIWIKSPRSQMRSSSPSTK